MRNIPLKSFNTDGSRLARGFTVLEGIIAIFVVTVGTTGVFNLVTQSVALSTIPPNHATAIYLAQEGIELVRNIRDTNFLTVPSVPWDKDLIACSSGCEIDYNDPPPFGLYGSGIKLKISGGFYNYDAGGEETLFKRKITINKPPANADLMEVKVEVSWEERGSEYKVETAAELYNWK